MLFLWGLGCSGKVRQQRCKATKNSFLGPQANKEEEKEAVKAKQDINFNVYKKKTLQTTMQKHWLPVKLLQKILHVDVWSSDSDPLGIGLF